MKPKTDQLLRLMHVLAWITFFGLLVKSGAILISYAISVSNSDAAKNLYMGLNLYTIRQASFWQYTSMVSFLVALALLEAYVAYLVTKVLSKIKLENPFTVDVSVALERISYFIFATWIIVMLYNAQVKWLSKLVSGLQQNFISGEFIFLAGVVFVMAQIFKKGVEIQTENELTI